DGEGGVALRVDRLDALAEAGAGRVLGILLVEGGELLLRVLPLAPVETVADGLGELVAVLGARERAVDVALPLGFGLARLGVRLERVPAALVAELRGLIEARALRPEEDLD